MIDIHKHRHNLDALIEACKAKTTLELYRENVCAQTSPMEIQIMGEACALRIIACYIWKRNYTGITAQFRARRAQLRNVVLAVCRINRSTLWRTLSAANIDTSIASVGSSSKTKNKQAKDERGKQQGQQ